jgi:ribosomal protein L16 Arg81 hydroxylase
MTEPELAACVFEAESDAERFFREHWQRKPWLTPRNQAGFFDFALSAAGVEDLLNHGNARHPEVSMVQAGHKIPARRYSRQELVDDVAIRPVDPAAVANLFAAGASVMVRSAHTGSPSVARLTRRLEQMFKHRMTAICFVSPAGGAAFPVHDDPTGTLVLQIAGEKHWVLPPVGAQGAQTLVMRPGSVLYLPPRSPHFVTSGPAPSVSLNYAIEVPTAGEVLRDAVDRILRDDVFQAFPDGDAPALDAALSSLKAQLSALTAADLVRREVGRHGEAPKGFSLDAPVLTPRS